jgi:hypothetical protein
MKEFMKIVVQLLCSIVCNHYHFDTMYEEDQQQTVKIEINYLEKVDGINKNIYMFPRIPLVFFFFSFFLSLPYIDLIKWDVLFNLISNFFFLFYFTKKRIHTQS